MPLAPRRHLPRLVDAAYRGRQFVHWSMTVANRAQGWLSPEFHEAYRRILVDAEVKYAVVVPVYCLMPDHLHCLAVGTTIDSDQQLWIRAVRRRINDALDPIRLQKQSYDHLLRPAESGRDAFAALAHYVADNPVRAGLVETAVRWPYTGACVSRLAALDLYDSGFGDMWWAYWNSGCD